VIKHFIINLNKFIYIIKKVIKKLEIFINLKITLGKKKKLLADFRLVISASGAGQAPLTSEQHHW
jgi:hypothetical protein